MPSVKRRASLLLMAALPAFLAGLGGCGVPSADGPASTYNLDFRMPPGSRTDGAIVFLVDGAGGQVFQQMLDAGELPAIRKYFVDRGLYVPRAVCSTPSITLVNLTSLVTGKFPGHHGIIGNNWFDRNELIWRNYATVKQKNTLDRDYRATTIYEYLKDDLTFSLFYQPHRGATKFVEDQVSGGPPFFMGWYELVDRLTLSRFDMWIDIARKYKRIPALTMVYLLSVDFNAYRHGVSSEQYRQALRHTDRQVGRVLADMERAGLLDKVFIAMTADHSLCDVQTHFELVDFLRNDLHLKVATDHWWENDPFEVRLKDYEKFSTVFFGSGDKYWALCLRRPLRQDGRVVGFAPWIDRPSFEDLHAYPTLRGDLINLPKVLIQQPAVDAIAFHDGPNCVHVMTKSGDVEFRQDAGPGGSITYRVVSGSDPLGWEGTVPKEALEGKPLGQREWLDATIHTLYPDLPAQIVAYFRAPRAGDIALFAAPGWDFGNGNRAGHGGLRSCDMLVPILLAGPGVPHVTLETPAVRTVDLMPTLLNLLGKPIPEGLDGRNMLPAATSRPSRTGLYSDCQ